MKPLCLSRSSTLYGFVFGRDKGWLVEGFPEPSGDRISAGLFCALFVAATIMRGVSTVMIVVFLFLLRLIDFLIDGSYVRGSLLRGDGRIVRLEPWPTWYGRRLPPYFVLVAAGIWLMHQYFGLKGAGEFFLTAVFVAVVFYFIDPKEKPPSEQLAEAVGPVIDQKLRLAYYCGSKLFPALHLID